MDGTCRRLVGRLSRSQSLSRLFVRSYADISPRVRTHPPSSRDALHPLRFDDEDHGRKIWIFDHWGTGQIVYALRPQLSSKCKKQFPFNGKHSVPIKMRKDHWKILAVIELGPGQEEIGRSIYQKLREFRSLHQISWGDELLSQRTSVRIQTISDQKANSIADVAAVLSGQGLGNLMDPHQSTAAKWVKLLAAGHKPRDPRVSVDGALVLPPKGSLYRVAIHWRFQHDREFAESWSPNVTHCLLPGAWSHPDARLTECQFGLYPSADTVESSGEGEVVKDDERGIAEQDDAGQAVNQGNATTVVERHRGKIVKRGDDANKAAKRAKEENTVKKGERRRPVSQDHAGKTTSKDLEGKTVGRGYGRKPIRKGRTPVKTP